jgi:hypothetical protein
MLGPADVVHCPVDDLDFRPYFADGACPICLWRPEGVEVARPWWVGRDSFWVAALALLGGMVVMGLVVVAVFATA